MSYKKTALIANLRKKHFEKNWENNLTILAAIIGSTGCFQSMKKIFGVQLHYAFIFHHNRTTSSYIDQKDLNMFGKSLYNKVKRNYNLVRIWSDALKQSTDDLSAKLNKDPILYFSNTEFFDLIEVMDNLTAYRVATKQLINHMPEDVLKKLGHFLVDARKYCEHVYFETDKFLYRFASEISKRENYSVQEILSLTHFELYEYIKNGKLPSHNLLKDRNNIGVLLTSKSPVLFTKSETGALLNAWEKVANTGTLHGQVAFPGLVRGNARVITEYKGAVFAKGDILVTGMTDPNYLSIMKKAGAIVTDMGGLLCHAAIVAREMKKPCIIGTKYATKVLKDGDLVEVDAYKGVVRKL
ncbi:MAG: PEP-utilizing enzyme [Candidatus Woesearchaeota archaeon]